MTMRFMVCRSVLIVGAGRKSDARVVSEGEKRADGAVARICAAAGGAAWAL